MEKEVSQKLGRQDWLTLGLNVLAKSGIEAVRVERLAELMNVTKGSFYWHFKNREDLLMAMLQEWKVRETDDIIKQVEASAGDANAKLFNLFQIAYQEDGQLEKAMRTWAANDTRSAAAIAATDLRRIDYIKSLFLQLGFSIVEATARARLAYYAWIGDFIVRVLPTQAERLEEVKLYHTILVRHD